MYMDSFTFTILPLEGVQYTYWKHHKVTPEQQQKCHDQAVQSATYLDLSTVEDSRNDSSVKIFKIE
jgi:hypothetical protein